MKTEFTDWEEASEALSDLPPYRWILEATAWKLREKTYDELLEELEYSRQSVEIRIPTTADLAEREGKMTDTDWIELGKLVAQLAADARGLTRK